MWVDYYGRVRLSQNKEQATLHLAAADAIREDTQFEYAYTKYDALGRPYEAGKIDINPTADNKDPLTDIESKVDINELIFDDNFPLIGEYRVLAPTDADSRAVETLTFELSERTKTYYGDDNNAIISDAPTGTTIVDPSQQHYLRNRVAAVAVYEEGEIIGAVTRYSYDIHGNVEQLWQQLPKIAVSENIEEDILFPEKTVRYDYDLLSGKVNQVIFQEGLDDEFRHKYSYDGDNKLTQVHTSLDGIYWTLEAKYFYYAHGPLARVEIGEHNIQGVDYYYTLQGWIKGVNSPEGTFGEDGTEDNPTFNTDEFAYTLHYFEGDYTARGNSASPNNNIFGNAFNTDEDYSLFTGFFDQTEPSGNSANGFPLADSYDRKSLYNGNVAAMTTSIAHFGRQEDGNGRATQSMNYRYDQLHRIAAASSKQWNPNTGVWESQTLGKAYQISYQYDRNGNIEKLHRKNQAGQVIDNLQYSYDPVKQNQLYRVTDQAANVDNADFSANGLNYGNHLYEYDEIGNLIKNGSDGIKTIIWNIQGKVEKVVRTNATITYRYDASGNRIIKQVATTTTNHINLYLRDASGNVLAIYEKKTDQTLAIKEIPIYGGSRLGQYRRSYTNQVADKPTALGQRVYEFSNHLQNVLVVLADFKVPIQIDTEVEFKAIVVSANDYYPFGMVMEGRKYRDENYDYRYGFNGKEDDKDFGDKQLIQDYGFRLYNPAIARFLSVDPLAPDYPELTVYQFASNTPIMAIDLDGLEMMPAISLEDLLNRTKLFIMSEAELRLKNAMNSIKNSTLDYIKDVANYRPLTMFFGQVQAGTGLHIGVNGLYQGGIAYDGAGKTSYSLYNLIYISNQFNENEELTQEIVGSDLAFSVGITVDTRSKTFSEHVGIHSRNAHGGLDLGFLGHLGLGGADDLYVASLGLGIGFKYEYLSTTLIESVSLTYEEADQIAGGAPWHVNYSVQTPIFNDNNVIVAFKSIVSGKKATDNHSVFAVEVFSGVRKDDQGNLISDQQWKSAAYKNEETNILYD